MLRLLIPVRFFYFIAFRSARFFKCKFEETETDSIDNRQFSVARSNYSDDRRFLERDMDLDGHLCGYVSLFMLRLDILINYCGDKRCEKSINRLEELLVIFVN